MVLPMHKLASYLIDARDSVQIQLSQQYADKNKNQEKLYISSKLAGTTMCKSLGVSVGIEKSWFGPKRQSENHLECSCLQKK